MTEAGTVPHLPEPRSAELALTLGRVGSSGGARAPRASARCWVVLAPGSLAEAQALLGPRLGPLVAGPAGLRAPGGRPEPVRGPRGITGSKSHLSRATWIIPRWDRPCDAALRPVSGRHVQ